MFESLSPELQRAARWVQQHQTALGVYSMRSSAKEAKVSPATMTRLAQRLGFEGFEGLRTPFTQRLAAGLPVSALQRGGSKASRLRMLSDPAVQLNALQQGNVASVLGLNPADSLYDAADTLLQARNVYFLGMRVCHGVAFHLHYLHGMMATNGVLLSDVGGTLADQITRLRQDDVLVAVSQSPYSRATVEGMQLALAQKSTVIALTDSALSPIARQAQHVLLFESSAGSFFQSTTGAEALGELLLATVAVRGGAATQRRLRQMQEHLRRTRAYWERPASGPSTRSAASTLENPA